MNYRIKGLSSKPVVFSIYLSAWKGRRGEDDEEEERMEEKEEWICLFIVLEEADAHPGKS